MSAHVCIRMCMNMCCVQHVCTHMIIDEEMEEAPGWSPEGECALQGGQCFGDDALARAEPLTDGLLSSVLYHSGRWARRQVKWSGWGEARGRSAG